MNSGGVPAAPTAVISLLIWDSLPGQRLNNTAELIEVEKSEFAWFGGRSDGAHANRSKVGSGPDFEFI